jgi:hypothetical protein
MKTDIKKILASKTKQALSSNILNSDVIRQNIVILDDLKNLIPALSPDEFSQLEENIKQHGCQTPYSYGKLQNLLRVKVTILRIQTK